MRYLIAGAIAGGTVYLLLQAGKGDSEWSIRLSGRESVRLAFGCCLCGLAVCICVQGRMWFSPALLSAFAGCLLTACVMDLKEQMVYRYVWAASAVVIMCLFFMGFVADGYGMEKSEQCLLEYLLEYFIFVLLQQLLFAKMYGRADCHAFCACGAAMLAMGGGFEDYVMHMAAAFVLLTVVQLYHGNVTLLGRLKKPVPMLPYITVAFWLWVDFNARKWYI